MQVENSELNDMRDHMGPVARTRFQARILYVPLDRGCCDAQVVCDLFGGHALGNQIQDFHLSNRQPP